MNETIVTLKKGEGRAFKAGGLWIYDNEIESIHGTFKNGAVVTVQEQNGCPLGRGFINQNSKIRVRMLTRDASQEIDDAFLEMRVRNAWAYRKRTSIPPPAASFSAKRISYPALSSINSPTSSSSSPSRSASIK